MRRIALILASTLLVAEAGQALAELPGDGLAVNGRSCFTYKPEAGKPLTRLLLELHKEELNPGDPPVIWARVYAEKKGEPRPGFNADGCSAYEPGDVQQANRLDHLRCGFACDGGTLEIRQAPGGIAIRPDNVFLRSCGIAEDVAGGFLLTSSDVGEEAVMTPVDDLECRAAMAPGEKLIEDAENAIQ